MANDQPHLFCFGLGYTGTVLAKKLRDLGWRVSGTAREPLDDSAVFPFSGHAEEVEAIAGTLRTATHVLSTIPAMELGDPILAAIEQALAESEDLTWIGYLSTTGVYGNTDGAVVSESTPTNPSGERGMRRVLAENQWRHLYGTYDLPVHVFRLPGIYGPGRSVFDQLKQGKSQRILKPGHKFNRIHVDDIAGALIASMKQPNPGAIYNVCDDNPVEPAEVTTYACDLMGIEPPPLVDFFEAEKSMSPMGRSFWNDNRLVSNGRIKSELGVELIYPDYKSGLDAIWARSDSQSDE